MEFRLAFINCGSLCPARTSSGQAIVRQKIADLAATLKEVSDGNVPHLVGLCEIGDEPTGHRLALELGGGVFKACCAGIRPYVSQTGLMMLYDPEVFRVHAHRSGPASLVERTKWLAVELEVKAASAGRFWFVVNHWKSKLGAPLWVTEQSRVASAQEVGDFFMSVARLSSDAMVLAGDFNCEPFERPFSGVAHTTRIVAVRERPQVLNLRNRLPYCYNAMWRWLGEPDPCEVERGRGPAYVRPRPLGTYVANAKKRLGWRMLDQLLVTKRVLSGGSVLLVENSIRVAPPQNDCTDHHAIGVTFEYS